MCDRKNVSPGKTYNQPLNELAMGDLCAVLSDVGVFGVLWR